MAEELLQKIAEIHAQALRDIEAVNDERVAQECRVKYLGRNGLITSLLRGLKDVPPDFRPQVGKKVNELKEVIDHEITRLLRDLTSRRQTKALEQERLDITLPGRKLRLGSRHPLMQVMDEVVDVFTGLGFSIYEGPEIETEYYNFEALNVSADHPARDMQDTFYVDGGFLLRTHTSPVQIHVMEGMKPPVMMIAPGVVYRRDSDVSHSPMFHQVEGLLVDQGVTFGHLKGILSLFCREMFGKGCPVRFRPSFFPFTEPSAEVDIGCVICAGSGCRLCKQTGWMEILGCGMVDPNVFHAVKYDGDKVTGFAFGMGIERIAMLKFGIDDIRLFFENDLRFLGQF